MENTLENKAKFISLYWGQRVLMTPVDNVTMRSKVCGAIEDYVRNSYLVLTPLSQITDEDANRVRLMQGYLNATIPSGIKFRVDQGSFELNIIFSDMNFDSWHVVNQASVDYLRSKGYALPFHELSVDDMINLGWVKPKEA